MEKILRNISEYSSGRQHGFTLVEILITILILCVLAAAITPNFSRFASKGIVEAANNELVTVKHSVAAYQSEYNGDFPCSVQPTDGTPQAVLTTAGIGIAPYLNSGSVVGAYTVNINGGVTGVTYAGLTWDDTNLCWKKA